MVGGVAFRLWAVLSLGRFFRVAVTTQDDHRLIERGPYRRLRHPSYTGALVTLFGFGLTIGNWLSLAAAVLPPLAVDGPLLTVRRFGSRPLTIDDLVALGTLTPADL